MVLAVPTSAIPVNRHDPFRTPDQRWQKACRLAATGRYGQRGLDPYVLQARKFHCALENARSELKRERLASKMPGIFYAHMIWQRSDVDDRWVLEARVLANEERSTIAHKMGTSDEVIFWYEMLYFDIRPYLAQRDYIVNRVLGPAAHRGVHAREFDVLLKIYALVGGPVVVDALSSMTSGLVHKPTAADELDAFWASDSRDVLRLKAALAARTIPVDKGTQVLIMEAHHRLLDIERQAGEAKADKDAYMANVAAAMQMLPFCVGLDDDRGRPQVLLQYDQGAVELRAHEALALVHGEKPASLELFDGFTIPEVPPK